MKPTRPRALFHLLNPLLYSTLLALPVPGLAADGPSATPAAAPKLILVLVVDGLPDEQVLRYREQFQGGFKRLLTQGAAFTNAHQAHGITFTAVGHAAILSGAYPYNHGIISNEWIDNASGKPMYCTQDTRHHYLGNESTRDSDGTSPANLRVSTLGDELRYGTGNQAKVITVSGKDRGAILLAGKTGTAYMYMDKSGNFASSSYYMAEHPQWVKQFAAKQAQNQFYGQPWCLAQAPAAYAHDEGGEVTANAACKDSGAAFAVTYQSASGKPDASYYTQLKEGPYVDQLTLNFARAAVEGENLGNNAKGVPDLLAVSLSSHDYVNHDLGPESKQSHDHLQHLDRQLGEFFRYLDKRIGLDNTLVVLTADHGFPNTPEFSAKRQFDAQRLSSSKLMQAVNEHLQAKFGVEKLLKAGSSPNFLLDHEKIAQKGLKQEEVELAAARFMLSVDGIANVYTRTQLENGLVPDNRISKLMQRAWHRQVSGDLLVVTKPYWYFGGSNSGTSHGSPYSYDTNVPLLIMGKAWIKPGVVGNYAEVVDIAPTLAHLLRIRPPSGSEGRVLTEVLR